MAVSTRPRAPATEVIVDRTDELTPLLFPRISHVVLAALRIVAGLMFVQHGVQKHFGLLLTPDMPPFTGAPEPFSVMWIAGTLEIAGGIMLALGLFTRVLGFVLSGFMAVAYFTVHAPQGFFPIQNKGELAALYSFIFLAFAALGGGRYSLDRLLGRRRVRHARPVRVEAAEPGTNIDELV